MSKQNVNSSITHHHRQDLLSAELHIKTSLLLKTKKINKMPFSHHSHSGQFCGHAVSTLEAVVLAAIATGMTTFCLTEHMPRQIVDFYPEETSSHTEASLSKLYDDFYLEARRLQTAYASQIQLFVGFEGEWIRPESLELCERILEKHNVDLFVGSVHHVYTVPIDFDDAMYRQAREMGDGSDERIFADYFNAQFEMLKALKPPVVAHFDLIRLKSDDPERSFRLWPQVWEKIERNLKFIAMYGGVLELNSSSLRKGMSEPYPQVEICKVSSSIWKTSSSVYH
jgi:histidinol-phosphatase (PHP family)